MPAQATYTLHLIDEGLIRILSVAQELSGVLNGLLKRGNFKPGNLVPVELLVKQFIQGKYYTYKKQITHM